MRRSGSMSRLPVPEGRPGPGPGIARISDYGLQGPTQGPLQERNRASLLTPNTGKKRTASAQRSSERAKLRADFTTPVRMQPGQQGRKSLAVPSMVDRRLSSTATKRLSASAGRSSQVGAKIVNDTRPLQDKAFQTTQIRRILDFLREADYPNASLTSKSFPLQAKEFVSVFNYLYNTIEPRCEEVLKYPGFIEDILKILKDLNYPGKVQRSHFVTLGSAHSWPAVLGCLSFVCDLAAMYSTKLRPNIFSIGFPSDFSSDCAKEKFQLEHHIDCFQAFNEGNDDYSELKAQYKANLIENLNVDINVLDQMEAESLVLREELKKEESTGDNLKNLKEQKNDVYTDLVKVSEYRVQLETRLEVKEKDLHEKKKSIEEAEIGVKALEKTVAEYQIRSVETNMSSCENKNVALIEEKRQQLLTAKDEVSAIGEEIFEKELNLSRMKSSIDALANQINALALEENIVGPDEELVTVSMTRFAKEKESTVPATLKPELTEKVKSKRAEVRVKEKEFQGFVAKIEQVGELIEQKRNEVKEKQAEAAKIREEIAEMKERARLEDVEMERRLNEVKEELTRLQSEDRPNIENAKEEIIRAERQLEELRKTREDLKIVVWSSLKECLLSHGLTSIRLMLTGTGL